MVRSSGNALSAARGHRAQRASYLDVQAKGFSMAKRFERCSLDARKDGLKAGYLVFGYLVFVCTPPQIWEGHISFLRISKGLGDGQRNQMARPQSRVSLDVPCVTTDLLAWS